MNEYTYDTDYGQVRVEEFFPPYSDELIARVADYSAQNQRSNYQTNYLMDDNPGSLGNLLRNNKLLSIYFGFLDNNFQFFLSTRIAEDTDIFLVCVRLFSKADGIKKPIHSSYILRLQMELARRLGYKECSFTFNVDARNNLVNLVRKRYTEYKHNPNDIKSLAVEMVSKFKYKGIHCVNYCEQHVFTAKLE